MVCSNKNPKQEIKDRFLERLMEEIGENIDEKVEELGLEKNGDYVKKMMWLGVRAATQEMEHYIVWDEKRMQEMWLEMN
jgi:hypothetical protein